MNIFGFLGQYWIVIVSILVVGFVLWLLHERIAEWIKNKIFWVRCPKLFENYFGFPPETDRQLRDLQLIKVVTPWLKTTAYDLHKAYNKETELLTAISRGNTPHNFPHSREELLQARSQKEHLESTFYTAKRAAKMLGYTVLDGYGDYIR